MSIGTVVPIELELAKDKDRIPNSDREIKNPLSKTLKSSIGATEKFSWSFQVPNCNSTPQATPKRLGSCINDLEPTFPFVQCRLSLLASSSVTKLWVASVSTKALVDLPFTSASMYINPLLEIVGIALAFQDGFAKGLLPSSNCRRRWAQGGMCHWLWFIRMDCYAIRTN